MPFANNSQNLGPGIAETPLINAAISLANGAITTTTTETAVNVGDDYLQGYALLTVSTITATSVHVQIYGSDTNSNIVASGSLVADFGVVTAAGTYFLPLTNLVPSSIPGSGPSPETAVYMYEQVLATVGGSGTVNFSVTLFI